MRGFYYLFFFLTAYTSPYNVTVSITCSIDLRNNFRIRMFMHKFSAVLVIYNFFKYRIMNDIKWIKITTDMFDNRKVKHLRKLPQGDSLVLIWVMLLTMAGRCNAGGMIFLTENIPYTTKMLADELDYEESTVILALEAFERLGMVRNQDDFLVIAGWDEYQNIGGMDKVKEQNKIRKQNQRNREKTALSEKTDSANEETTASNEKTDVSNTVSRDMSRDSHVTVT